MINIYYESNNEGLWKDHWNDENIGSYWRDKRSLKPHIICRYFDNVSLQEIVFRNNQQAIEKHLYSLEECMRYIKIKNFE